MAPTVVRVEAELDELALCCEVWFMPSNLIVLPNNPIIIKNNVCFISSPSLFAVKSIYLQLIIPIAVIKSREGEGGCFFILTCMISSCSLAIE